MKTRPNTKISLVVLIALILLAAGRSNAAVTVTNPGDDVLKAYNLRMDGKVDQAKELLENILRKDSTNSKAWYELARLQHYMLVGMGNVKINDIVSSMNTAVTCDPKNVIYAYYRAVSCFLDAFYAM